MCCYPTRWNGRFGKKRNLLELNPHRQLVTRLTAYQRPPSPAFHQPGNSPSFFCFETSFLSESDPFSFRNDKCRRNRVYRVFRQIWRKWTMALKSFFFGVRSFFPDLSFLQSQLFAACQVSWPLLQLIHSLISHSDHSSHYFWLSFSSYKCGGFLTIQCFKGFFIPHVRSKCSKLRRAQRAELLLKSCKIGSLLNTSYEWGFFSPAVFWYLISVSNFWLMFEGLFRAGLF